MVFESPASGMIVFFKPPGWEVDDEAKAPAGKRLSSYLQALFPCSAIVRDLTHAFGVVHRLDVPSSGLILAGHTYEGYYQLKWQLDTAQIVREYVVLCHGWVSTSLREIDAPLYHVPTDSPASAGLTPIMRAQPSTVTEMGKPAKTLIRVLAHGLKGERKLSLLVIRICTGRRHQIRAHLHWVQHPTVADGKYTPAVVFSDDLTWCPRNFIHRQRLQFLDAAGVPLEAVEPLPDDLRAALGHLTAAETHSDRVLRTWRSGPRPLPWDSYEVLHVQVDSREHAWQWEDVGGGCGAGSRKYDMGSVEGNAPATGSLP